MNNVREFPTMAGYFPHLHRFGEAGVIPHRQERLLEIGGEWYFSVRRGVDQGPYATESEARMALTAFIEERLVTEENS